MSGKNAYDGALFLNIEHKVSQTYPLALNTRRRRGGVRAARRTNVFELNLAFFYVASFREDNTSVSLTRLGKYQ